MRGSYLSSSWITRFFFWQKQRPPDCCGIASLSTSFFLLLWVQYCISWLDTEFVDCVAVHSVNRPQGPNKALQPTPESAPAPLAAPFIAGAAELGR